MADEHEDFNSSDIEFELPPSKGHANLGKRTIEQIIASASEDRIASKKTVQTLQFGRGAPGTINNAHRWVLRFNSFRQSALRQDVQAPFKGEDLLRFFDSIIGKLKPSTRNKPVPSTEVVKNGVKDLITYGTFTYQESSGYKITRRDVERLSTWLDDAVKSGRLIKGRWKKRVWLNYTIVSRMTREWLDHYNKAGTLNWDLILARHLSIVLISALGMRVGDVTRSTGYHGIEYLKFRDIDLVIEGDGEAKIENIRARIILAFCKGKKDIRNADDPFYISPLEDSEKHMCIISLLLVHALRHGLVRGTTIQEVLDDTIGTPDSTVVWLQPDLPVTAGISNARRSMDLQSVAHPCQILGTIKRMGLISNLLVPVNLHSMRYGAAQDAAHLPVAVGLGFTNDTVRQTMGHRASTLTRGVTEMYVGKHTQETYNLRAATQYVPRFGAKFSEQSALDTVKRPMSSEEIAQWQQTNEPEKTDHESRNGKDRARNAIRQQRHQDFVASAPPEKKMPAKTNVLSEKSANTIIAPPSGGKSAISNKSGPPIRAKSTSSGGDGTHENENIDPRLLEEEEEEEQEDDLESIEVEEADLETLTTQVLLTQLSGEQDDDDDDDNEDESDEPGALMALEELLNEQPPKPDQLKTKYDFINFYSRINAVKNATFAAQWARYQKGVSYEDSIERYAMQGNSRESAAPFCFFCQATPGCPFSSIRKNAVVAHETICSPEYVARERYRIEKGENFSCNQCPKAFLDQPLLKIHIKNEHTFVPIPCPEGCNPEKIYQTEGSLNQHKRVEHSGYWPTPCLFPSCEDETLFKSPSSYKNHLVKAHELTDRAARAPYFPPTKKKVWQPTACPLEGCTATTQYAGKAGLAKHLRNAHKYERQQANELSACGLVEILTIDVSEEHITRKARLKPWQKVTTGSVMAEDDEDDEYDTETFPAKVPAKK